MSYVIQRVLGVGGFAARSGDRWVLTTRLTDATRFNSREEAAQIIHQKFKGAEGLTAVALGWAEALVEKS